MTMPASAPGEPRRRWSALRYYGRAGDGFMVTWAGELRILTGKQIAEVAEIATGALADIAAREAQAGAVQ